MNNSDGQNMIDLIPCSQLENTGSSHDAYTTWFFPDIANINEFNNTVNTNSSLEQSTNHDGYGVSDVFDLHGQLTSEGHNGQLTLNRELNHQGTFPWQPGPLCLTGPLFDANSYSSTDQLFMGTSESANRLYLSDPPATIPPTATKDTFSPRKCDWEGCGDQRTFKANSAYKKHMNKHFRPFKCTELSCKANDFTTAGDLKRHQQQVHGPRLFTCHVQGCKRNRKGFGRKEHLALHVKQVHSGGISEEKQGSEMAELEEVVRDMSEESVAETGEECSEEGTSTLESSRKACLVAMLRDLEERKMEAVAKFEKDISAVKHLLSGGA